MGCYTFSPTLWDSLLLSTHHKSEHFTELFRKDCNVSFYSSYFCSKHDFLNILASLFFLSPLSPTHTPCAYMTPCG